jgi:hypothetical protein
MRSQNFCTIERNRVSCTSCRVVKHSLAVKPPAQLRFQQRDQGGEAMILEIMQHHYLAQSI